MATTTLVDDAAWIEVGRELRRLDPGRYEKLLGVARKIVKVHLDPLDRCALLMARQHKPTGDDFD